MPSARTKYTPARDSKARSSRAAVLLPFVDWSRELVDQLDVAMNESQVCGLSFDADAAEARLLVEVVALPETGPIDRDPRRVLVLSGVSSIEVILRADRDGGLGPVLPVESFDALERFFVSLGQADAMYGWEFIDRRSLGEDWNAPASLTVTGSGPQAAGHTLHWFAECGRPGPELGWERFLLQGVIRFGGLRIERADARPVSLEEFATDGRRWWVAFRSGDSRLSSDAQGQAQAGAAHWRSWG
jgi:hypothetical protein